MRLLPLLAVALTVASALPPGVAHATDRHEHRHRHHQTRHHSAYRVEPEGRNDQQRYGYAPRGGIGPYVNNTPSQSYGFEAAPGSYPARGYGQDPRPNGGFAVNPYGYGNYTMGSEGGFGGYPPGSAGAHELQIQQDRKCRVVPEQC